MTIFTVTTLIALQQVWALYRNKSATIRLALLTASLALCCVLLLLQFHGTLPFAVFTSPAEDSPDYMATQYRALLTPLAIAAMLTFQIGFISAYIPWPRGLRWLISLLALAVLYPALRPVLMPLKLMYYPALPAFWASVVG